MNSTQKKKVIKPLYTHWNKLSNDKLREILLDFKQWCEQGKLIINKKGHAVPFLLNEAQEEVAKLILSKAFAPIPEPIALVIHKSRQMGISVVLAALEQYLVDRKQNLNITHLLPDEQLAYQFFNEKWQPLAEGCLLGTAEVLTKDGWVKFDDYKEQPILVGDGKMSWFEKPSAFVHYDYDDDLIEFSNRYYYHLSTKGHKMVFTRKGKLVEREAIYGIPQDSSNNRYITTTELDGPGLPLSDDMLRLAIAIQADGHYEEDHNSIQFNLTKDRKIERLISLLDSCGLKYSVHDTKCAKKRIRILAGHGLPNYKELPFSWIGETSLKQKRLLLDEASLWDGNFVKSRNQTEYNSTSYHNASFINTLARTYGIFSTIRKRNGSGNRKDSYTVSLLWGKKYITTQGTKTNLIPYKGKVHCVTVSTHKFWVRINGKVSLTGNTHPQLLPDMYPTLSPVPYIKVGDFHGRNMNCNIKIGGAGSPAAGRSGTQHVVILDEYAFYSNVNSLERGILATQPKTGMVLTVYVSTANGMNWFYDTVKQAESPNSRMEHLFLPWHMLKEYEMEIKPGSRFYDLDLYKPTEYDMKLMDIFEKQGYPEECWLNKMEWYDYVLDKEAKGDRDYMFQEYPSTPEESFEVTGRPCLPAKVINYWLEKTQSEIPVFVDQYSQPDPRTHRPKITIQQTNKSAVRMWKKPTPGHRYLLGCDPSEGDYAGDRSAWVIVDTTTMDEVCFSADYLEAEELADTIINYARFYNNAVIVVERNMGQAVIEFLKASGYHRIYIDPNTRGLKYGVRTTQATKNEALRRLRFLLNNGLYKPHDMLFLEEAQHFSWRQLPGGSWRVEAMGTDADGQPYHDDTIMARAVLSLALDMRKYKGYYDAKKPTKSM